MEFERIILFFQIKDRSSLMIFQQDHHWQNSQIPKSYIVHGDKVNGLSRSLKIFQPAAQNVGRVTIFKDAPVANPPPLTFPRAGVILGEKNLATRLEGRSHPICRRR